MTRDTAFFAEVADKANIPEEDARPLVDDFLGALTGIVTQDAWDFVRGLIPEEMNMTWEEGSSYDSATAEEFVSEVSRREPVSRDRAAAHARAVATTIRDRASEEQLAKLSSAIRNEDILALFEETRGGLTTPQSPTEGEVALGTPPKSRPDSS